MAVPTPNAKPRKPLIQLPRRDGAHLEALLSSIGEGMIATDQQGCITRINQVALDMLGYKQRDVIGQRFTEKIVAVHENGSQVDLLDRPIVKAFLTGQSTSERTLYRLTGGELLPVQLTVAPILFRGKPVGAIEVFRDLTAEIENEKLKSDFISIASHQLRTPLSAVNMYTRMLQDGMAGPLTESQLEYTRVVLGSVERMNELIDTLLNITRIEAGGLTVKTEFIQFDELLTRLISEFTPGAHEKKLEFTHDIELSLPELQSDSLLLQEVCANLISNAIKYTPEAGSVHVGLKIHGNNVLLSVKDTGYGIPDSAQKYIFSKFFRAPNITTNDVSGTGLGLYLTKALVERLGGDIWFESAEDAGSTFYVSLPITAH